MIAPLLGFAFAFAESGLGLGAVIPGEVAITSLAAKTDGPLALAVLGAAVALGATAADHLGLFIGRAGGPRLRESRLIARVGVERWDRAGRLMQRHGFWAVLASRLLPLVRTVMPVVAGAAHLRYRWFLLASVLGAIAWSSLWVGAGAGIAATGVLDDPWLVGGLVAVIVAGLVIRALVRRRRARTAPEPTGSAPISATEPGEIL
ncbi:DedA family protein [Aeromicrobium sp. SMF47]|uniref:DedA family protein n=1 Tax=Aeromicrobium yanjiei TaxID=2662028 RepID=A0A5Q2MQY8_9ACTN|nr:MULTISPECIES: VTT domain-containing protein [Aeromicrobium]MRJ75922.1 DedA family protein [Aeromicrobium yanjiei]MRK00267.1 DedA family protein [Aeromicrobium sp. S22]QGG42840.1 DedA family protein [Aeromicrobium yanjiei]